MTDSMEPDELTPDEIDLKKMFGYPPRLLGMPVVFSAAMPDDVIAFGDTTPVEFGESPLEKVIKSPLFAMQCWQSYVSDAGYDAEFREFIRAKEDAEIKKTLRYEILRAYGISPEEFDKQIPGGASVTAKKLLDISERLTRPKDDDYLARALVAEKRVKELEKENNRLRLQVMRRGRK